RTSQKRYARIHLSETDRGEYSVGLPSLNWLGGSNSTRGYMSRTQASVPTPMLVRTAPHPRKPKKSRRVRAIRQAWPSGLVPSSLLAGMPARSPPTVAALGRLLLLQAPVRRQRPKSRKSGRFSGNRRELCRRSRCPVVGPARSFWAARGGKQ